MLLNKSAAKVQLFLEICKSFVFFLSTFDYFSVIQYVKDRFALAGFVTMRRPNPAWLF